MNMLISCNIDKL